MHNTYITKDFYLTAYLITAGQSLKSLSRTGGVTTFVFNNTNSLQKLVTGFYSPDTVVHPMHYGNAIRNLKTMMYSTEITTQHYVQQPTINQ